MLRLPRKLQSEVNSLAPIRGGFKLQGREKVLIVDVTAVLPVGEENGDVWVWGDGWLDAPGLQSAGGREEIEHMIRGI